MGNFVRHEPCPSCGSKDNLARYDDGSATCFGCGHYEHAEKADKEHSKNKQENKKEGNLQTDESKLKPIITQEKALEIKQSTTCKSGKYRGIEDWVSTFFGVRYEKDEDGSVIASYYPCTYKGELSGYKIREHPKTFSSKGRVGKECDLFGQFRFKTPNKYLLIVGGECFDAETEILTDKGFVKFPDLTDESYVAEYYSEDKTISYVKPERIVKKQYNGNMVKIQSKFIDVFCTENHNLFYYNSKGAGFKQKAKENVSNTNYFQTSVFHSGSGCGLSKDQIALTLAVCADSKLDDRVTTNKKVHFAFVKDRKINRLRDLLVRLNIAFTSYVNAYSNGKTYTTFNFFLPDWIKSKKIPKNWVKDCTLEEKKFIISEMALWDGNHCKDRSAVEFSSKHESEANTIYEIGVTSGLHCSIGQRSNNLGTWYRVKISYDKNSVSTQGLKNIREIEDYTGLVYCVTVPSGLIVVRRNGKTLVVGNCDQLSAYQMLRTYQMKRSGEDYDPIPVVSPTIGETSCAKQLALQYQFFDMFERIIVCFDNDAAGAEATEKAVQVLPKGKIYTMQMRYKDPNEYLVAGEEEKFIRDFYNAKQYVPAGVVGSSELYDKLLESVNVKKIPLPPFMYKLDEMIGSIDLGTIGVLAAGTGAAKCLAKGTNVMMADYSLKKVEDIVVGDRLVGPDGTVRNVLGVSKGVDQMYQIDQINGISYTVNSAHILSVKASRSRCNKTGFFAGMQKGDILNISVLDYLALSKYEKAGLKGWKASFKNQTGQQFDPDETYLLGWWLADGTSSKCEITISKNDKELFTVLDQICKKFGYKQNVSPSADRSGCTTVGISKGFWNFLGENNLQRNKHIPEKYFTASLDTKLQLLAGFVDGDGHFTNNCYSFTQKNCKLTFDFIRLLRSVGFVVHWRKVFQKCQNFEGDWYIRISVSGELDVLPNRLTRKKCKPRLQTKDASVTGITVKPVDKGEYYGFTLDGDRLFCLEDGTVSHNTTFTNEMVYYWLFNSPYKVGIVSLELTCGQYAQALLSRHIEHKISGMKDPDEKLKFLTEVAVKEKADELFKSQDGSDRFVVIDERDGSIEVLQEKIQEMIISCGCKIIISDPISDIFDGLSIEQQAVFMKWQKSMVKNYNVTFINIAHIRKGSSNKDSASTGAFVPEEAVIGSSTLIKSASWVIMLQRDKYAEDPVVRNTTHITLSKNRSNGITGKAGSVYYCNKTHKLHDLEDFIDTHPELSAGF